MKPLAPPTADRRRFLLQAAGTLACVACSSSSMDQSPASGPIAAGKVAAVAVGSLTPIGDHPVVLGRDARGLYAMSTICTHRSCNMRNDGSVSASGLVCDCHGSRFDANGGVTVGPATKALDHYRVELATDGTITVQASQIVGADVRTVVA
ncbi:MAG: Rieske (2Fe-2S) protein [Myxococcales bacterium]|nr:Rieske (2Fe-2S) protein [Myxococcales bacterium]